MSRGDGGTPQARRRLARRARNSAQVAIAAAQARRVAYWPADRISRLQERRIREIVAYAYRHVPFYREVMQRDGLEPSDFSNQRNLARLPVIEPAEVQGDPEYFTSSLHGPGRRWGVHTSGSSTGLRRIVYWDNRSMLLEAAYDAARPGSVISALAGERWVGTIVRALLGDRDTPTRRLLRLVVGSTRDHARVSIFPADLSARSIRGLRSEETLIPRRVEHYHNLSPQESLQDAIELLGRVRPRVVFSFGSYADQFFQYLSDLHPPVPLPRVWVYTGDMVSAQTRDVAASFGCRLHSIYGTTEAGAIAFQCERTEGFHLNIDHCAVRLVDEEGVAVPPGQPGEVVVSNLENRAMVLLNLRIGDRGVLAEEPCPCGRGLPVLARLEGRSSDLISLADGRRIPALVLEGMFRVQLRQARQVQMVQPAPGQLLWRVVPFRGVDRTGMQRAILEHAREVLGPDTLLRVDFVEEIAEARAGKFQRLLQGQGARAAGQ